MQRTGHRRRQEREGQDKAGLDSAEPSKPWSQGRVLPKILKNGKKKKN